MYTCMSHDPRCKMHTISKNLHRDKVLEKTEMVIKTISLVVYEYFFKLLD